MKLKREKAAIPEEENTIYSYPNLETLAQKKGRNGAEALDGDKGARGVKNKKASKRWWLMNGIGCKGRSKSPCRQ